jgi:TrkA domain protein
VQRGCACGVRKPGRGYAAYVYSLIRPPRIGRHDLVVYDRADPERAAGTVVLRPAEARLVADVLDATVTMDHVADLIEPLGGVQAVRIRIRAGSRYVDRPLGDTRARTRTGASIVAVLRGQEVTASPGPEFVFRAGDIVVAVGHEDGLGKLRDLLAEAF